MFIEFIYKNTLGKTYSQDPSGVDYWVSELVNGKSKGQVVASLINAAVDPQWEGLPAQDQFMNKVDVCDYTASAIATVSDVNDLSAFVKFISEVTQDPATVASAQKEITVFKKGTLDSQFSLLTYNYNVDSSSVRVLSNDAVNANATTQAALSEKINANDNSGFNTVFEIYVNDLLETSFAIDSIPTYAPRGESNHLLSNVVNGQIDYSGFILKGDINSDSKVDFTDLQALKEAIFSGLSISMYDVNLDGSVDVKDIIFLVARIGTEIYCFDFYTPGGEKIIDIPTRSIADSSVFDYPGSETQVMVVPKDINKTSGFTEGLSDINDVWYKKKGWVYQDDAVVIGSSQTYALDSTTGKSKGKIISDALNKLIDFDAVKNDPYLVGWNLSVQYVDVGTYKALDNYGIAGAVS